jgi:hypothetical protein
MISPEGLAIKSAHAGELADLLFRSASAGIGHDVNRIDETFFVPLLHLAEHFVGNFFRDRRPDFDDLVVAFAVGDGAVQILLLHRDDLLVGVLHQRFLLSGMTMSSMPMERPASLSHT